MTDYGLPEPDHKLLEAHPTVSSELLPRLGHGDITVKPNIDRFSGGRTVRFVDGSEEEIDMVVYCTGYKITFPFLDRRSSTARQPDAALPPRRRPERPGLYFIGLVQPLGADHAALRGPVASGSPTCSRAGDAARAPRRCATRSQRTKGMAKRFVASKRHTIEVDFHPYLREIRRSETALALPNAGPDHRRKPRAPSGPADPAAASGPTGSHGWVRIPSPPLPRRAPYEGRAAAGGQRSGGRTAVGVLGRHALGSVRDSPTRQARGAEDRNLQDDQEEEDGQKPCTALSLDRASAQCGLLGFQAPGPHRQSFDLDTSPGRALTRSAPAASALVALPGPLVTTLVEAVVDPGHRAPLGVLVQRAELPVGGPEAGGAPEVQDGVAPECR